jgi:ligand-binding sensor domain-containing protein
MAIGSRVSAIVEQPDGVVWIAASFGLARFDGAAWTDVVTELSGTDALGSLAAAPDGSIWVGERDSAAVRRFDGRSWVSYGPADGLPEGGLTASVVVTKGVVFVGTRAGIYRLAGSRWEPVEPPVVVPTSLDSLLAVSRDELWATGDRWGPGQGGVWHFENGAWTRESIDPGHPGGVVNDLVFAPDGTLWAAGEDGVAYRRDGHWTIADASQANEIAIDRTGTVWYVQIVPGWGMGSSFALRRLAFDGAAWVSDTIADPVGASSSLAIDANGALWMGDDPFWDLEPGGLARYDGQGWETVREIAGSSVVGAFVLGTDPSGDMWVALLSSLETGEVRVAHSHGADWTVVPAPVGEAWGWPGDGVVLDPNGTLWASTGSGPARYDDARWTYPYAGVAAAGGWQDFAQFSVAADGTVYGISGPNVVRLPAEASQP